MLRPVLLIQESTAAGLSVPDPISDSNNRSGLSDIHLIFERNPASHLFRIYQEHMVSHLLNHCKNILFPYKHL